MSTPMIGTPAWCDPSNRGATHGQIGDDRQSLHQDGISGSIGSRGGAPERPFIGNGRRPESARNAPRRCFCWTGRPAPPGRTRSGRGTRAARSDPPSPAATCREASGSTEDEHEARTGSLSPALYKSCTALAIALAGVVAFADVQRNAVIGSANRTKSVRAPHPAMMAQVERNVTRMSRRLRRAMRARTPQVRTAAPVGHRRERGRDRHAAHRLLAQPARPRGAQAVRAGAAGDGHVPEDRGREPRGGGRRRHASGVRVPG